MPEPRADIALGCRLFLIGYWMIQACNAIGISLHYNVAKDMVAKHPGSRWVDGFLKSGTW